LLANTHDDITLVNDDASCTYAAGAPAASAIAAAFLPVLPNGDICAIPLGTGFATSEDAMDEHQLVAAIDAGSSQLGRLDPQIAYFQRRSRAESTRATYLWAWHRVLRACEAMDRCPLPMSEATAAMVLVDSVNDGLVVGSLRLISSVIGTAHEIANLPSPTETEAVRSVMRGIARTLGDRPDRKVALTADELLRIHEAADRDPNPARGLRDWALIAFGFAGAFRRSEIVARNTGDLEDLGDELRVHLDRSKTDQLGRGATVSIRAGKDPRTCPIAAFRAWQRILPGEGALFRPVTRGGGVLARRLSVVAVSDIVKGYGIVLDLPEDRLGAHSLRAGMVTALIDAGVGDALTMAHSRHQSHDTLRKYYRSRAKGPNFTELAGL
jgi:integrase